MKKRIAKKLRKRYNVRKYKNISPQHILIYNCQYNINKLAHEIFMQQMIWGACTLKVEWDETKQDVDIKIVDPKEVYLLEDYSNESHLKQLHKIYDEEIQWDETKQLVDMRALDPYEEET